MTTNVSIKPASRNGTIVISEMATKQTSFGALQNKIKEINTSLADMGMDCCEDESVSKEDLDRLASSLFSNVDYLYQMINKLSERIYESQGEVWNMFAKHLEKHAPPFDNAAQLEKFVKMFMPGSYDVQKRTLYASDGSTQKLVIELSPK